MHQRDYILRLIEQWGVALARLRRRILRREKAGQVREDLAKTAGEAGVELDLLKGFDLNTLRMFVMPTGEVEPARCWLMAEILYLDGLEAVLSDRPAEESLMKARALFELIRPAGGMLVGLPEAADRIGEIDKLLDFPPGEEPPNDKIRSRRVRVTRRRRSRAELLTEMALEAS